MKIPKSRAEFIALLNTTEKALQNIVERKVPHLIPGISATLPTPTKPIIDKTPSETEEKK